MKLYKTIFFSICAIMCATAYATTDSPMNAIQTCPSASSIKWDAYNGIFESQHGGSAVYWNSQSGLQQNVSPVVFSGAMIGTPNEGGKFITCFYKTATDSGKVEHFAMGSNQYWTVTQYGAHWTKNTYPTCNSTDDVNYCKFQALLG